MENNKNNVILTIIGVATLLVALIGASFAYFSATGGTATQDVGTGTLKISAVAGAVNGSNIKPVLAADVATLEEKLANADVVKLPITVNTTGTNISSEYNIYLTTTGLADVPTTGEGGNASEINWELIQDDTTTVATGTFESGDVTELKLNPTAVNIVDGGATDSYKLLIYITDTEAVQDQLQGLQITAFATVKAQQK